MKIKKKHQEKPWKTHNSWPWTRWKQKT